MSAAEDAAEEAPVVSGHMLAELRVELAVRQVRQLSVEQIAEQMVERRIVFGSRLVGDQTRYRTAYRIERLSSRSAAW